MSARKDYCVGCKTPTVDDTVKGDVTDGLSGNIYLENARDNKTLANMVTGSNNGCRNCIVILDALSSISRGKDQKRLEFIIMPQRESQTLEIQVEVASDEATEYVFLEVFRQSNQPQAFETCGSVVWNLKEYSVLSENTSSQETLDLIASWATHCVEHHEHCPQRLVSRLPKRVLEITADHVFLKEKPSTSAPYVCLSHCWGIDGPAIRLTADTVELLYKGYVTSDLPKTFRDAVDVCRHLGICYLWIDALCILQDSQEDWKEAAATMAGIYEHAYMTIAATSAQDSNGGLFSSVRPLTTRLDNHPHLYIREWLPPFPGGFYIGNPRPWPLLNRAWVYQERRLSPRTVHFCKHQVYWECQTNFTSEDASEYKVWITDADSSERDLGWGDRVMDSTRQWQKIVSEYTKLKLTYDSDRLPAIAALADRMSRLRQADDVYIAGMWRNSMLSDLLWQSEPFRIMDGAKPLESRPVPLLPSWSWAFVLDAKISWRGYAFPDTTQIISLDYTAIGATHLGEVINASIVLRTSILDLTGAETLNSDSIDEVLTSYPPINSFARTNDMNIHAYVHEDYTSTTAETPYWHGQVLKLLVSKPTDHSLGGVIVRQIAEKPMKCERIGFLEIPLEKYRWFDEDKPDETGWFDEGERERRIDELMRSLPVEEVTIV